MASRVALWSCPVVNLCVFHLARLEVSRLCHVSSVASSLYHFLFKYNSMRTLCECLLPLAFYFIFFSWWAFRRHSLGSESQGLFGPYRSSHFSKEGSGTVSPNVHSDRCCLCFSPFHSPLLLFVNNYRDRVFCTVKKSKRSLLIPSVYKKIPCSSQWKNLSVLGAYGRGSGRHRTLANQRLESIVPLEIKDIGLTHGWGAVMSSRAELSGRVLSRAGAARTLEPLSFVYMVLATFLIPATRHLTKGT